ncbi:hypothetical protein D918_08487 [Trichuris suis]
MSGITTGRQPMADEPVEVQDEETHRDIGWIDLTTGDSECGSSFTLLTDSNAVAEAQQRSSASSCRGGSRQSPKSTQSAVVELESSLENVKYHLVRQFSAQRLKNVWMQDWSSRPEASPPHFYRCLRRDNVVYTPPNSPFCGEEISTTTRYRFSLRHSSLIRHEWFSVEVISVFICGHVLSFILGLCIGLCLCRCRRGITGQSDKLL